MGDFTTTVYVDSGRVDDIIENLEFLHPDDLDRLRDAVNTVKLVHFEIRIPETNGERSNKI